MRTKHFPKRLVKQMGGGVIGPQLRPPAMVDNEHHRFAGLQGAGDDLGAVNEEPLALFLGISHLKTGVVGGDHAGVAHLAAGFPIEGRLVHHNLHALSSRDGFDARSVAHQRLHHAFGSLGVIAEELGSAVLLLELEPDRFGGLVARTRPAGAGLGLLTLHSVIEAHDVDADPPRPQCVLGQVEREAIGVVELEGSLAIEAVPLGKILRGIRKQRQAAVERLPETGFLELQSFGGQRLGANELRIGAAHLLNQRRQQPVHQGLPRTEQLHVAHGAAHDATQYVATALVRRQYPVGDQEGRRPKVVCDDPEACRLVTLGLSTDNILGGGNQVAE